MPFSPRISQDKIAGVPIATRVIEGTCRHLVEDRMNVTDARWSLAGAEAVLRLRTLRALRASGDFDAYWDFFERQEYERNHASHDPGHHVPETVPGRRRRRTLEIITKKEES